SGDGVDILSKVPDAQQQTGSSINKGAGEDEEEDEEHDSDDDNDDEDDDQENDSQRTESDDEGDDFVHPNLSTYIADDQEKEKEEEKADDDDDDVTSDQKVSTPPDYELTEEDENQHDDDSMGEEQGDEDNGELVSSLESDLSELKQTNQFAEALSSIPGIVDKYLVSKKLEFIKSSWIKWRKNNSIDRSDVQKNLYRALLKAYNSDKDLLSSLWWVVTLKQGCDDQDKDKEPSLDQIVGQATKILKGRVIKRSNQKRSKVTSYSKGMTKSPLKFIGSWFEEGADPQGDDLEDHLHLSSDTGKMMYLLSGGKQMLMNDCGIIWLSNSGSRMEPNKDG
ncbi:hypothetical protein Tco_1501370, partial [Tanacetum coccineum]